jgi:ABC-2 type transport system ATP-binding protein
VSTTGSRPPLPIRVERVSKRFDKTLALDAVSLEVGAGEIFGLVGPNGAGKTTLIRTILDIIKPDSGTVEVQGHAFSPADRDHIGYLPEERGLYTRQPVGAVLEYLGALKGLGRSAAKSAAHRWLERFELADMAGKKVDQLSKGNQQKVQIAATFLAGPSIAILDEPLSGLDPVSARLVNSVIREYAAAGHTVILSTHQMNVVETLCSRVFMIARGRRVLYGDLKEIKRQHSTHAVLVRSSADYSACPLVARVTNGTGDEDVAQVDLVDAASPDAFLAWLVAHNASIERFERLSAPLEDIFVRLVQTTAEVA